MSRVTNEELKGSTTKIGTNEPAARPLMGYTLFNINGVTIKPQEPWVDNDVFARILNVADRTTYEVRVSRRFQELWNPYDKTSIARFNTEANNTGFKNSPFIFIPCSKESFESYVKFLGTKNINYFIQAQRGLNNC